MKKYGKQIFWILCLSGAAFCYLCSAQYARRLLGRMQTVTLVQQENARSVEQARQMQELEKEQEQPFSFAAWHQEEGVEVQNPDLGRRRSVAELAVCGNTDIVVRASGWLGWTDMEGCLVDEETAWELFGSVQVVGQTITCREKEYVIRGILYEVEDTVVLQAPADYGHALEYVTVRCRREGDDSQVENVFAPRHGLYGKVLKTQTLSGICSVVLCVLPLTAGCWLLERIRRLQKVQKSSGWQKGALWMAGTLVLTAMAYLVLVTVQIPSYMLPTKWSDFSFWSSLWEKERESFLLLLLFEKQKPQAVWMADFYRTLAYSGLSWLLFGVARLGKTD